MKKSYVWGLLCVIVVLAAVLRGWHLDEMPFRADEFLDVNAVVGYAHTGTWQAWDHNLGQVSARINPASDARAWIYRWQVAEILRFFPPTEAVLRSVSVAWGVITVVCVYGAAWLLTRQHRVALVAAFLCAVSIVSIETSRTIRMYAFFVPMYLIATMSAYCMFFLTPSQRFAQKIFIGCHVNIWYVFPTIITFFCAFITHALTANSIFTIGGSILFLTMWSHRIHASDARAWKRLSGCGLLAVFLGSVLFPQVRTMLYAGIVFFENHWSYIGHVFRDAAHPLASALLMGVGLWWLWRRHQGAAVWLGMHAIGLVVLAVFFWNRNVGAQYIAFAQPFVLIAVAMGIIALFDAILESWRHAQRYSWLVMGMLLLLVPSYGAFAGNNSPYHHTRTSDTPDYRKVFGYVRTHATQDDVLVTRNMRNYYWSGMRIHTFDFGSERDEDALSLEGKVAKITPEYMHMITTQHSHGWVVLADNDTVFISKEARDIIEKTMTRIDDPAVRGPVTVYRW